MVYAGVAVADSTKSVQRLAVMRGWRCSSRSSSEDAG